MIVSQPSDATETSLQLLFGNRILHRDSAVFNAVRAQVISQVTFQVGSHVKSQVESHVKPRIKSQMNSHVESQANTQPPSHGLDTLRWATDPVGASPSHRKEWNTYSLETKSQMNSHVEFQAKATGTHTAENKQQVRPSIDTRTQL